MYPFDLNVVEQGEQRLVSPLLSCAVHWYDDNDYGGMTILWT